MARQSKSTQAERIRRSFPYGIGLGLKGTLGNLASGVLLISLQPFKVGDRIEAAGAGGVVEGVHVFATTLRTNDGIRIIVPNASITNGNITNHSG